MDDQGYSQDRGDLQSGGQSQDDYEVVIISKLLYHISGNIHDVLIFAIFLM